MSNLFAIDAGPKAPADLSQKLREYADAVDRGEIVDFVGAYVQDGEYRFMYGASIKDCLVMATLLHANCVQRYRP